MKDEGAGRPNLSRGAAHFRTVRFISVGCASTAVYWIVLLSGVSSTRLAPIVVSIVAYGAGFLMAYYGHRRFTYRSVAPMAAEMSRFLVVHFLCFILGNLAFWYVGARLDANALLAGAALTGTSFSISYAAAELWIFREVRQISSEPSCVRGVSANNSDNRT